VRRMPARPLVMSMARTSWPMAFRAAPTFSSSVPASTSVGPPRLPKLGSESAACMSIFQSSVATSALAT